MKHTIFSIVLLLSAPLMAMEFPENSSPSNSDRSKEATEAINNTSINSSGHASTAVPPFPSNPSTSTPSFGAGLAELLANREATDSNPNSRFNNPPHGEPGHRCGIPIRESRAGLGSSVFSRHPQSEQQSYGALAILDLLIMENPKKEEAPLMKLMENADAIHDTLLASYPLFLEWTKKLNSNDDFAMLAARNAFLRIQTNNQDMLLTQDLEKPFSKTQAFARLYSLSSQFRAVHTRAGKDNQKVMEESTFERPADATINFGRTVSCLHDRLEKLSKIVYEIV